VWIAHGPAKARPAPLVGHNSLDLCGLPPALQKHGLPPLVGHNSLDLSGLPPALQKHGLPPIGGLTQLICADCPRPCKSTACPLKGA